MKFAIYLVSALVVISCVAGKGSFRHYHHHHYNGDQLSDLTSEILDYGINFIFERAADNYGVSSENVEITKINDLGRRNLDGPITRYWFNVAATNNNDATLRARFAVEYNNETEEKTMGRWHYNIHYYADNANEENEVEGFLSEEDQVNGGEGEVEVEIEIEVEVGVEEEGTDDNNEDFQEVPDDEIENDSVIQGVLDDGAAFIFDRAADRFGVSNSSFEITDVDSVFRRNDDQNNLTIYRINIDATNNDDARVEARLTIEHNNETGENTVGPWRYSIRYRTFDNEENSNFEENSVLEFDMNDESN